MATPYPQVTLASLHEIENCSLSHLPKPKPSRIFQNNTSKVPPSKPSFAAVIERGGTTIPNRFLQPNSHSALFFGEGHVFAVWWIIFLIVMHWLTDCCGVMWTVNFFVVFCEEKGGKELLIAFFFWRRVDVFRARRRRRGRAETRMSGVVFSYRLILLGPPFFPFFLWVHSGRVRGK